MEQAHLIGAFEHDSDYSPERVLEQYDPYIVALVTHRAYGNSTVGQSGTRGLDIDDLTQEVRFKLWMALRRRHIEHYRAYIRAIVQNEFNDIPRKPRLPLPLLTNDDGELFMEDITITEYREATDPETDYIEGEAIRELIDIAAPAISMLPPRQRAAMICKIKDDLGECIEVINAFARCSIQIELYHWPEDEAERNLLKASLPAARRNLLQKIGAGLEAFRQSRLLVSEKQQISRRG